jgi:uncharacterized membrane protein
VVEWARSAPATTRAASRVKRRAGADPQTSATPEGWPGPCAAVAVNGRITAGALALLVAALAVALGAALLGTLLALAVVAAGLYVMARRR